MKSVKGIFDKAAEDGSIRISKTEIEQINDSVRRKEQLKKICEIGNSIIQNTLENMDMADYKAIEPELHILQDIFESAYNFECIMEMIRQGNIHIGYDNKEE